MAVGDEEFRGFTNRVDQIPSSHGVLILGDRVGEVVTPVGVEPARGFGMQEVVRDLQILYDCYDRFFGEPVFAFCYLDGESVDVCCEVAEDTRESLREWGWRCRQVR